MSLKGKAYIVGACEHPTRKASDKSVALLHAECAKGALEDAGLTKDDVDAYYLCRRRARPRSAVHGGLHEPEVPPRGQHRCRRLVLSGGGRPRAGGDRARPRQGRADHPGRASAQRGQATGTAPRAGSPAQPEMQFEYPYGPATANMYAMCADAPHARIRHHQRATRLDQGRGLASRAIQPARHAARRGDGGGRGELADGGVSAAPAGLLRDQRRRRRAGGDQPGDRQKPEAAEGEGDRRR